MMIQEYLGYNALVEASGIYAINAWQIHDFRYTSVGQGSRPGAFVNGNTRKVSNLLIQTRQKIEKGGLPRIRISYKNNSGPA
jgi:hypothetical protein